MMTAAILYVEKDLSQCVKIAFDSRLRIREAESKKYFYVFEQEFQKAIQIDSPALSLHFDPELTLL